jgi:hypothetical protein
MSQINFENAQKIVEKSLRQYGFGGEVNVNGNKVNLENGWKQSIVVNDQTFDNPQNLQKLRDAVAQAIVDVLKSETVSGSISQGTQTTNNQNVVTSNSVLINGDSSAPSAARVGDSVLISLLSSPTFFTWMTTVSTLNQSQAGTAAAQLATLSTAGIEGKINSGSSSVKIG